MGVVSKITKRVDVPGEDGHWIEIRMLSWLTLDKSKKERLKDLAGMRDVVALFRERADNGELKQAAIAEAAKDRIHQYDRLTLLRHGVVTWSYGDEVDVESFDEPTADWAARQILEYTNPGEAQVKTSSSPGTGS